MLIRAMRSDDGVSLDMTPMIDMVFLLLTFFLAATTFYQQEREMKIALPFAASAGPISAMLQEFVVNVDDAGRMYLGGRLVEPDQLRSKVREAVSVNAEQKVTVRGDRRAAYEHIVAVLDICKGAGIQEPYLDTVLTH